MHGGAKGSGAPQGNRNSLKTGLYTAEQLATRRQVGLIMRAGKKLLHDI
jgi:hypothetical protein